MAFVAPHDRVLEHSTSNSQTVFAVTGAVDTSYNAFSASMSIGDITIGGVVEPGVAFKSGVLTYSASNQVTVTTATESKGTFSAGGVKQVFMGLPATRAILVDGAQSLTTGQKTQARANIGAPSGDDSAWTAYTPTFSALTGAFATAGNAPVASGSFKQIGKTVHFKAKLVVGAAGVGTAAGATLLSLPVTAAAATGCYPTGRENQTSGSLLQGWQQSSTTTVSITTNALTFASGNNTTIEISGTYEAA